MSVGEGLLIGRLIACPTEVGRLCRDLGIRAESFQSKIYGIAFSSICDAYRANPNLSTRDAIASMKRTLAPDAFDVVASTFQNQATREKIDRAATLARTEWQGINQSRSARNKSPQPRIVDMNTVKPQQINWLWKGYFPAGMLSMIAGLQGIGKSFTTVDMAARISTGRPWPDGSKCEQGNVAFMAAEDLLAEVLAPRLIKHGAEMSCVKCITGQYVEGDDGHDLSINLNDLPIIEDALSRILPRLLVIDPIGSFTGGKMDAYRDNEVRAVLSPLQALAERYKAAIVFVAHHGKAEKVRCADDLILGSRAFSALSRVTRHLFKDDNGRRMFLPGKNNLAPDNRAMAFSFVPDEDDPDKPPMIEWEPATFFHTADEYLRNHRQGSSTETTADRAYRWLRDYLDRSTVLKEQAISDAKTEGYSERSIERAAADLNVTRSRSGSRGKAVWTLPDTI